MDRDLLRLLAPNPNARVCTLAYAIMHIISPSEAIGRLARGERVEYFGVIIR
ncbi:hypothetical protein PQU92_14610 [Asticcacaulis sp. BYS171W]|uniref:Uncharacterized protein n=1 Tax=Asticcacaulis aquaticus TaxID=2984212 RepID=A0ABT5HWV4_9CAUL|nr:hypothetical protein [Asticcacaulis aquaticus]MDC7684513.1 hypothetical protein [Asticcacaulis aquaticus]